MFKDNTNIFDKLIHVLVIAIIIFVLLLEILPYIFFGDDFVFTIHDNLDQYPGFIRAIRDSGAYFHPEKNLNVLNGIQEKYFLINYNFHDFFIVTFGYVLGETMNKIVGVLLGFFSMYALLEKLFKPRILLFRDVIAIVALGYAILPCNPNRTVAFGALPAIVLLFVVLRDKDKICKLVLLGLIVPFFSCLRSTLVFMCGFWFIGIIVNTIKNKRINLNLLVTLILIGIMSIPVNLPSVLVALSSVETNRKLIFNLYEDGDFRFLFLGYLGGQYHAPTLHKGVLLIFLCMGTLSTMVGVYICSKKYDQDKKAELQRKLVILIAGFMFWILSAALMAAREAGLRTGVPIIDSFSFGRVLAFTRLTFSLMFVIIASILPDNRRAQIVCLIFALLQLFKISTADVKYNDDYITLKSAISDDYEDVVTYRQYVAEDMFSSIKEDINYNNEGVAAYTINPQILMSNGFNTLTGYCDVHPMKWQNEFREIIEPALNEYPDEKTYYDGWGGRMYLYGEEPNRLLINTDAFVKYGGQYIFSGNEIYNADELDIQLINKYSNDGDAYHIYLYEVR